VTLYLDHAATSPLRPEAREAFLRACEIGANASSVHGPGRKAKVLMEDARASILSALEAEDAGRLVFTSGGTEANALALRQAYSYDYIVVSEGEHDSIYVGAEAIGRPIVKLPLTADGEADVEALRRILAENPGRPFVCVMAVNNETGVCSSVGRVVHERDGWLHIDGVQALGKFGLYFGYADYTDSLSLSAHKIGGPQGVGALVYNTRHTLRPMITGGGQELGLRAGTENVPGIAAFAAALEACGGVDPALKAAQADVESALKALGVEIIGERARRASGILCLAQPHWSSPLQLIHMDMNGIAVSSGSACSSGKVKASRVATAMGRPDLADKVLRVSAGWTTTAEDWQTFLAVWSRGYEAFLKRHAKEVA
jgi:cysteine desulfurase